MIAKFQNNYSFAKITTCTYTHLFNHFLLLNIFSLMYVLVHLIYDQSIHVLGEENKAFGYVDLVSSSINIIFLREKF